ncbi:MAG: hypothetical protein EU549_04525 [Promethearchaeota archaeon]|nr:MAG: hypothetical protein EU549_04525 [Candidatus Lokiarchaeota archaeon]
MRRKLRLLNTIKARKNNNYLMEDLEKLLKVDPKGAIYLFLISIKTLNADTQFIFDKYFNKNKYNSKFLKLSRYFRSVNKGKVEFFALFFAGKIEKAIDLGLENSYFDLVVDIIKLGNNIPENIYKKILRTYIKTSSYDLVIEILKIDSQFSSMLQIFSSSLLEKYLEERFNNNFFSDKLERIVDYILIQKEIETNPELNKDIKAFKSVLGIIRCESSKLEAILSDISQILLENKYIIDLEKIDLLIDSLYISSGGFTNKFFSLFDLFKFQILNSFNGEKKKYYKNIFRKAEVQSFNKLFLEFNEILDDLSKKYERMNKTNSIDIPFDAFLTRNILKYFSYSGCTFYKGILIRVILKINREMKSNEKKKELISFYLRFSNNYWNYILKKMYESDIELSFFSDWSESQRRDYKKYIVRQILILRCIILYKAVDFRVLNKVESYNKVLSIINNASDFFRSNNYKLLVDNENFLEEILVESGWNEYYNQRKV